MAIKKSISTSFGITIQDAYHRIENITYISKESVAFNVVSYNVSPSDFPVAITSVRMQCSVSLSSNKNVYEQIYDHIKTLDAWRGCTDC